MTEKEWFNKWEKTLTKNEKKAEKEAIKKWKELTEKITILSQDFKEIERVAKENIKQIDILEKERNTIWQHLINEFPVIKLKTQEYAKIKIEEKKEGEK